MHGSDCVEGGFEGKKGFGEDASLEAIPAVIWEQDLSMMGVIAHMMDESCSQIIYVWVGLGQDYSHTTDRKNGHI